MNMGGIYPQAETSRDEYFQQRNMELERENARLVGQIQGMWEVMKFFKLDKQTNSPIHPV